MDNEAKKRFEGTPKGTEKMVNKKGGSTKKSSPKKKKHHKLTRAEYDDLRQIDWVPFDPYSI